MSDKNDYIEVFSPCRIWVVPAYMEREPGYCYIDVAFGMSLKIEFIKGEEDGQSVVGAGEGVGPVAG